MDVRSGGIGGGYEASRCGMGDATSETSAYGSAGDSGALCLVLSILALRLDITSLVAAYQMYCTISEGVLRALTPYRVPRAGIIQHMFLTRVRPVSSCTSMYLS